MIRRWSAFILSLLLASPAAFSQLPQPKIPDFAVPMNLKWMGPSDTLEVFVVGDIMSHGKVMKSAEEHGYSSFFKHIEDKIAYARQFYNDVVLKYNNRIMQVPTNIIAGMFHFVPAQYFAADEQSRQVPQVNFTNPAAPQVRF